MFHRSRIEDPSDGRARSPGGGRPVGGWAILIGGALLGDIACSSADVYEEELQTHESALVFAESNPPKVTTAPTFVVGTVPKANGCPRSRFFAIMHVEPEPMMSAQPSGTAGAVQPAPTAVVATVVPCPVVPGYDASSQVNGVCTYDAPSDYSPAPYVPGALEITRCPLFEAKGGGPPDERAPAINNYYSELDMLLVVFRTADLKAQLVRPNKSTITLSLDTAAGVPYTKTLSSLGGDARVRADFAQDPSTWFYEFVDIQ